MTTRTWERAIALLALALVTVLVLGGGYLLALFFLAITAVWFAYRLRPAEPGNIAGAYAIRRGQLELFRTSLLFAILLGATAALFVGARDHWNRDSHGQIATYALAGFAFLLLRELERSGDTALNWLLGGRVEQRVGAELDQLRNDGWTVIHNLLRDDGYGNIDHLLTGPAGAYAIETKSGQFRRAHLRQAGGNAAWAKQKLGVGWVTAVLCLNDDSAPRQDGAVWIVGRAHLVEWLRARRRSATAATPSATSRPLASRSG